MKKTANIALAISVMLATAIICYGVEPLSIQQMLQNSPKETAPQGSTRIITVRGGVVRQMSYSSVYREPSGPGIPYALGNGLSGVPFTPSNKIPANYVALPQMPLTKAPCGNGYHIDSYDAGTGQFTCSADASTAGANDPNAVHVNAAGEIAGVMAKSVPSGADTFLGEDSDAGNVKKRFRIDALPFQPPGSYLTTGAINTTVQGYSSALSAVSGTNTGDETQASIKTKLGAAGPGDGYMTAGQYATLSTALQPSSTLDATKLSGTAAVNTTGNAATATKLATPRTINGVNFDGSANITVADATKVPTSTTVNGHALSGNVTVTAADVGLGSVNNTSDAAKPISTATQSALDMKAPVDNPTITTGITAPVFNSNAADGDHMVFCANSGDMTTTGWGVSDAGRFCYNQATSKYRYWNGSGLADWPGGAGGGSGTVTSITASSPLTGGTITGSGTIGIPAATSSVSGYLTSSDWTTFNGKQGALVSGTNIKTVAGISLLGSGDIGTIPTSKGGTGATDFAFSGTAHTVTSVTGTKTVGKQTTFDANGNLIASAYDVGASGGGGGSGTVANSSNAYRLAGYAASGTTVSDSGITYATDGSNITTAQSATDPDALALRTSSGNGSGFVAFIAPSSSVSTPYGFQFPATAPAAGKTPVYGTPASGTVNGVTTSIVPVTWADPGITSVSFTPTGDIAATGGSYTSIISPILTVTKIQGVAVDNTAPTTNDVFQYNGTSWLHVTPATLKGTLSLAKGDVGLGSVENTALSTWAGSTNITTLGAAAATSLAASGLIDGTAPTVLSTSTTYTLGTSYKTNYTFNNYATAGTAITYTLPTAAAGRTECVKNYTGKTGTLRVNTSAAGQYIDMDGTNSASGGYVISGGALGDGACFVGADSTHWVMYAGKGTWTLN